MTAARRRIGVVTTSRADLSPLKPVMAAVAAHPALELLVYATGMHLAAGFESSLADLEAAGFPPQARIPSIEGDGACAAARAIARGTAGFADLFAGAAPDLLLVLGDRYDMLPAVLAALPFRLPVAHLHGGEVTQGAMDDAIRHAVSKMAHLHFVAAADFAARLRAMGEEGWRVHVVGAPGLDNLAAAPVWSRDELAARLGVPADVPYSLATLHPETLAELPAAQQADIFARAAGAVEGTLVLTAPNADPGHGEMRARLRDLAARRPRTLWLDNAGPDGYPNLLRAAACVAGNSSSGVIEAGFFHRPVVNVGGRQQGRPMGANVTTVGWDFSAIAAAWRLALAPEAAARAAAADHPYGRGGAAGRIASVLAEVELGPGLVRKAFIDTVPAEGP